MLPRGLIVTHAAPRNGVAEMQVGFVLPDGQRWGRQFLFVGAHERWALGIELFHEVQRMVVDHGGSLFDAHDRADFKRLVAAPDGMEF